MSTATCALLVEIGTEELPPKALQHLAEQFRQQLGEQLQSQQLIQPHCPVLLYYSPRRLAVNFSQVAASQPDRSVERYGPAIDIAFDDAGKPTRAAQGFAKSCHTSVEQLEQKDGKLYFTSIAPGQSAQTLVPACIHSALDRLPIPRRMRWGNSEVEFVRPVHWAVVLFGSDVIDCEILGVRAGRSSRGHRFHHPGEISLQHADEYAGALREARVWLNDDAASLKHEISRQVQELAHAAGGTALNSEAGSDLVAEIAALVEWPAALCGSFAPDFLRLPEEVLIATLEDQQRYFAIRDHKSNRLLPHFIAVANIESTQPARVRSGNERVIVPRLSDAMFFWEQDRSVPLERHRQELAQIIFQHKLGSLADKMQRVAAVAAGMARQLDSDVHTVERAAQLAKCDLLSQLVGEFPALQGTIGGYLAVHDGEPDEVAAAIEEHYRPRFAGDSVPQTRTGQILAVADKLDTIVGIFAIGQAPSGEKDPFGLRRAALGVLRILIECRLPLDLDELIQASSATFATELKADAITTTVFDFMMERLRRYYLDTGVTADTFEAVLARRPAQPLDFHQRLQAVQAFRRLPEADSLAAANKRIVNILRQADAPGAGAIQAELLQDRAEQDLATALDDARQQVEPLLAQQDYSAAMQRLAGLRDHVDTFFDQVMVMCEDEAVRNNRLALLQQLGSLFQRTADISRLQG